MKKAILIFSLLIFISLKSAAEAEIPEYFNSFYLSYLDQRKVCFDDREILNFLHKISNDKLIAIEDFLKNAECKEDILNGISLVDEEYRDFLENLEFETSYVCNCPLSKRGIKKFKKAHKNFMRLLQKKYLGC